MNDPGTPQDHPATFSTTVSVRDILHKPWGSPWQFWFKEQSKDGKHNDDDANFLSSFSSKGTMTSVHVCSIKYYGYSTVIIYFTSAFFTFSYNYYC